jgi:hypothetical protein
MRPSCQSSTSGPLTICLADSTAAAAFAQWRLNGALEIAVATDDVGSIIGHGGYRGAWRPGEFSHSLMSLAVSICLAFLRRSSRSGPGANLDACFSRRAFWSVNRSANVWGCERDRNMRSPFLFGSGGSVQHSQSPMTAGYGAVMMHPFTPGCRQRGQYCSHTKRR